MATITVSGPEGIVALARLAIRVRDYSGTAQTIYVDCPPVERLTVRPDDESDAIVNRWHNAVPQAG